MNTSALKRFAQQARNILKSGVEKQLISWGYNPKTKQFTIEPQQLFGGMMFGEKMIDDPTVYPKWVALKKAIQTKGVNQVVEEAAYTWFNRLIAIRILAKNNYIAPQLEYVSATNRTPLMLQNAKRGNAPAMDAVQLKILNRLLDDDRQETELFALLITAYCHQSDLLQRVFGRMDDYTELLLPADILATNGFVALLNTTDAITDDDYRQVELIGWLYQFYISEKKDEVFKSFKNKKKAEAEDIPAATQIFTPNWIVKYMVQNTVGRLWLDLNPDSRLRESMKYLVESDNATPNSSNSSDTHNSLPLGEGRGGVIKEVAHLKLLDPASGSGHILVEGFDLLYVMYREEGYTASEAVRSIFANNLFGLDIDPRAAQLATFALLLKAAAHDRSILASNLLPHVYAMPEKEIFTLQEVLDFLGEANATHTDALYNALVLMQQSQNLGSIMKFNFSDEALAAINTQTTAWKALQPTDLLQQDLWKRLAPYMQVLQVLTAKYEAVAANPPYMGGGNMNDSLKTYLSSNYPDSKSDLFAVFIEAMIRFCAANGKLGCITMESWMFLSSYEKLRKKIIDNYYIASLAHFGWHIIGIAFGTAAMILNKQKQNGLLGQYSHLTIDDVDRELNIPYVFPKKDNGRFSNISQANFEKIPGSPIAYWVSERVVTIFEKENSISDLYKVAVGLQTGSNETFVRCWHEISSNKFKNKWIPYNKGGEFRKWYGNQDLVVEWENNGFNIKNFVDENGKLKSRPQNEVCYFQESISWSFISSGSFGVRYFPNGFIFDVAGSSLFPTNDILSVLGYLNSKVVFYFLNVLAPTINYQIGDIKNLPYIKCQIDEAISKHSLSLSKTDWDSRETSWNFEKHPLINIEQSSLQSSYQAWEAQVTADFYQLHTNEVELNRIFIDIYGLQDELTPEVKLKDITILQEELNSNALGDATEPIGTLPIRQEVVMRQLISYLMGCLMGRYRLDKPGLHIAHPAPTAEETAAYTYNGHTVEIDDDGIIPLMDSTCSFADNALIRIKHLLEVQWGGDKQLIETINYLQAALGKDLETYLVRDFWKDHCTRYQKRPIYWLFASPKGAFRVIAYMHRMNKYTVEKIRSNYLLVHIRNLENQYDALKANESLHTRDDSKRMERIKTDLLECREYDLLLKDVADHQISFDLDDGVVVNYAKFGSVVAAIK